MRFHGFFLDSLLLYNEYEIPLGELAEPIQKNGFSKILSCHASTYTSTLFILTVPSARRTCSNLVDTTGCTPWHSQTMIP